MVRSQITIGGNFMCFNFIGNAIKKYYVYRKVKFTGLNQLSIDECYKAF